MLRGRIQPYTFFVGVIAATTALTAYLVTASADETASLPATTSTTDIDDVTPSAKAEYQNASTILFKVSYKHDGQARARLFLIPRELAVRLDGGFTGNLEVKSLVLASNGEPKQLILDEKFGNKSTKEVEFQVGWNGTGSSCTVAILASKEGKWGGDERRDLGLPIEDTDCRHYIFKAEANKAESTRRENNTASL